MRRRTTWLALGLGVLFLTACATIELNLGPRIAPLRERTIAGTGEDKILMVSLDGLLMIGGGRQSQLPYGVRESLIERLAEELDRAAEDKRIKALLVRIDSPGGTVSASDVVHHQIKRYKERTGAKVTACLMGVAASGGYYAAVAADRVIALPTTITGSIGVISLKLNLAGLMVRHGVETETVKSAPLKDMWSPFRPATDDERRIMKDLIGDMYMRFRETVRTGRPNMTPEQLDRAANAQVFTAAQALALGLIDRIGYPEDALEEAKKAAGLKEARLVVYQRPGAYRPNIYAQSEEYGRWLEAADLLALAASPQLMYLWLPGWQFRTGHGLE
ncbi:MAG: signal peptide peptidase SppA [Thermodesulfobacteriota bacterium]